LAQPDAFRLVGIDGHIHAPAMIEAERAMHLGLAFGADRKRMCEPALTKASSSGARSRDSLKPARQPS
jgi:hypothetical protein